MKTESLHSRAVRLQLLNTCEKQEVRDVCYQFVECLGPTAFLTTQQHKTLVICAEAALNVRQVANGCQLII